MHHDVGAVFDRPEQDRRGDRIVDDQRDAVRVGDARERFEVANIARGVPDTFAEDRARVVIDQLLDGVGPIRRGEADCDALTRQHVCEQGVRGAVELWHRHDIAAELGDVERRIVERRLSGTHAERFQAALERGDAALQDRRGGVRDAAVAESLDLEIEQGRAMVGTVEGIGHGLIDRDRHRLRRRIDVVAAVNGDRLASHAITWR